jgi:hypothetical protein
MARFLVSLRHTSKLIAQAGIKLISASNACLGHSSLRTLAYLLVAGVDASLLSKALQAAIDKLSRSAEDLSKAVASQDRLTVQVAPYIYAICKLPDFFGLIHLHCTYLFGGQIAHGRCFMFCSRICLWK